MAINHEAYVDYDVQYQLAKAKKKEGFASGTTLEELTKSPTASVRIGSAFTRVLPPGLQPPPCFQTEQKSAQTAVNSDNPPIVPQEHTLDQITNDIHLSEKAVAGKTGNNQNAEDCILSKALTSLLEQAAKLIGPLKAADGTSNVQTVVANKLKIMQEQLELAESKDKKSVQVKKDNKAKPVDERRTEDDTTDDETSSNSNENDTSTKANDKNTNEEVKKEERDTHLMNRKPNLATEEKKPVKCKSTGTKQKGKT